MWTNMDKKNVTFSRLVPCAFSQPGNGPGVPLLHPAYCAVGSLVLHRL